MGFRRVRGDAQFGVSFIVTALLFVGQLLAQSGGVPFINQPLAPGAAVPGSAGFTLTVNGCNFVSGATVKWNGTALATTFVSSIQLTAAVPASDVATAGTASVTVSNPGGPASSPMFFEITTPTTTLAFAQNEVATITGYVTGLVEGDFNGDGKPDLAVSVSEGQVTVLLNNGDGTFKTLPSFNLTGLTDPSLLLAADINNDGKVDLLAYGQSGSLIVLMPLLGNGDGTFTLQPTEVYDGASGKDFAIAADFNHDGNLDLVYGNPNLDDFVLQFGNGDGTFQNPVQTTFSDIGGGIAAGDFNRDGTLDLELNGTAVALGKGDGTFGTPAAFATTVGPTSVADLNNDGFLDILGNDQSDVYLGHGDGTFGSPIPTSLRGPTLSDMSGDGIPDTVTGNGFYGTEVAIGNGDGTFQPTLNFPYVVPASLQFNLRLADFTGDGRMDMAMIGCQPVTCPYGSPGTVTLLLQTTAQVSTWGEDFGDQDVGTSSATRSVDFTNVGSSNLTINSVSLGGTNPGDFEIVSNTCGATLAPNTTCTVGVAFAPAGIVYRYASLLFNDGAAASPQTVLLSGFGVGTTPALQISPASLSFGSQAVGTTSAYQTITVSNTGNAGVTFSGIGFVGTNPADFTLMNGCYPAIGVGNSCKLTVTFTPTAAGTRGATLSINDNVAGSPQSVTVSGTGATASIGLGVPSGGSSSQTITAGSTASYTLAIGGAGISGTASFSCSGAPTGATCSVPSSESVSATTAGTFKVSVSTSPRTSAALLGSSLKMWAVALIGLVMLPHGRWKTRRTQPCGAWLPILLIMFLGACGGGSSSGGGSGGGGTPAGTYTLTVAATVSGTSQSQALTLIVQ